jgi:uncharacterized Rmd1/YagE family protein
VKLIGQCLNMKQKVISSTYVLDSPEPTWENQSLAGLHREMVDMFEIRERYRTLEYKLRMVQDTAEILADLSRTRRSLYVEVAILIFVLFEVVLFVYSLAIH